MSLSIVLNDSKQMNYFLLQFGWRTPTFSFNWMIQRFSFSISNKSKQNCINSGSSRPCDKINQRKSLKCVLEYVLQLHSISSGLCPKRMRSTRKVSEMTLCVDRRMDFEFKLDVNWKVMFSRDNCLLHAFTSVQMNSSKRGDEIAIFFNLCSNFRNECTRFFGWLKH